MVASKVEIWNQALSLVGQTTTIATEDDVNPAGEACRRFYDTIRGTMFRRTVWPWAIKQTTLAKPAGVTRTGYDYVYTLPTDLARPLALLAEGEKLVSLTPESAVSFEIRANDGSDDAPDGALLLCDIDSDDFEVFEYVAIIETPSAYPPDFVEALAAELAVPLALALVKDVKLAGAMRELAREKLAIARATSFASVRKPQDPRPPAVRARG